MHAYVVGRVWEAALKMLMFTLGNEGSRGIFKWDSASRQGHARRNVARASVRISQGRTHSTRKGGRTLVVNVFIRHYCSLWQAACTHDYASQTLAARSRQDSVNTNHQQ